MTGGLLLLPTSPTTPYHPGDCKFLKAGFLSYSCFEHIYYFTFIFYDLALSQVPGVKKVLLKFVEENC